MWKHRPSIRNTSLIQGRGCSVCSNRKILIGYNDLWTTHPETAKLLKNEDIGYKVTHGSGTYQIFVCPECESEKNLRVNYLINKNFPCSKCSDGLSYPEKFVINVLAQTNIEFGTQEKFDWSQNKKYDFYIPSLNCIIETHGGQHYGKGFDSIGGRSLEDEENNDKLKGKLALENGIKKENYIVIDCRFSEINYIKNSILNSEMSRIINLKNIDWLTAHKFACTTLVKKSCDIWNSGIKNTVEIGNKLNLNRKTICEYLKQGSILNWCDYDTSTIMRLNGSKAGGHNSRSVVQLTISGEYVSTWNSILEAENRLKITSVSRVCRGVNKTSGGYVWIFKEDYDKYGFEKDKYKKQEGGKKPRKIIQLSLEYELIKEWNSVSLSSRILNIAKANILRSCKNKSRNAGGFKWMYKEDYDKYIAEQNKEIVNA